MALNLALLIQELQRYKGHHQVCRTWCRDSRTHSLNIYNKPWFCVWENTLFAMILYCKKPAKKIEMSLLSDLRGMLSVVWRPFWSWSQRTACSDDPLWEDTRESCPLPPRSPCWGSGLLRPSRGIWGPWGRGRCLPVICFCLPFHCSSFRMTLSLTLY